jgi:DNA-binding XRE family transcriptional regulator
MLTMSAHVTYSVTDCKGLCDQIGHHGSWLAWAIVAGMVTTRIRKHTKPRLFLKEHRVAKGVSARDMAGRLGIERESVYRIERETRANSQRQAQWAAALDIEPEALWRLPMAPRQESLDEIIRDAPPEIQKMAADIVRRLVGNR